MPRLLNDLRLALATLYSLPLPPGAQPVPPKAAHDFLMDFQSRNVRRRIHSVHQSHRDQANYNQGQQHHHHQQQQQQTKQQSPGNTRVEMGSSWLACIFILLLSESSTTEQLFCAQTLLHRLRRRTKISEAIDWEVEHSHDYEETQLIHLFHSIDVQQLAEQYKIAMRAIHPFVAVVLDSVPLQVAPAAAASSSSASTTEEERIKGELSLLTIASILFLVLSRDEAVMTGKCHLAPPIATTLASAMIVIALRLRYQPQTQQHLQQQQQQSSSSTLMSTITHVLSVVWNTARSSGGAGQEHEATKAFAVALQACLGAIPETVMGGMNSSGARGKLSIDPQCIQAAMSELRQTGVVQLWETLQQHNQIYSDLLVLETCTQYAKYLPLPTEFIRHTCPLVNTYLVAATTTTEEYTQQHEKRHCHILALSYVTAVLEAGAWRVEDVLAHSLGLSEQQQVQQNGKKKQSNKSKKRYNEKVESSTTESSLDQAQREVHQRGESACFVAFMVWETLVEATKHQVAQAAADPLSEIDGGDSIGCLTAAANSCLPHMVKNPTMAHSQELFRAIVEPFQELCRSPNRSVRGLVSEALYSLHATVVDIVQANGSLIDNPFEDLIVEHFYGCAMGLAIACCYPPDYFDSFGSVSDEALEIERNDVRDLVRTVSGSTSDGKSLERPPGISVKVLTKLVSACHESVTLSHQSQQLCPESAVHAFSSLAKPLNQSLVWLRSDTSVFAVELSVMALQTLFVICCNLIAAFKESPPLHVILPVCRTAAIAIASLSPFLGGFCMVGDVNEDPRPALVRQIVEAAVQVATFSIECIPELLCESSLGRHRYDVRGTMRGPSGEDHVGCLALMRLVHESDDMARVVVKQCQTSISRLSQLQTELKRIEVERGQGIWHGKGVTPKSRRILLNVLCRIETIAEGPTVISALLGGLFNSTIETIASFSLRPKSLDEHTLFELCEAVHDIVSFPSAMAISMFDSAEGAGREQKDACVEALSSAVLEGYRCSSTNNEPNEIVHQWNRLRAAMFYLLTSTNGRDMQHRVAEMIQSFVQAECEAIQRQCAAGRCSTSSIFCDEIVSEDAVPAGVFVRVFSEVFRTQFAAASTRITSAARTLNGGLGSPSVIEQIQFTNAINGLYACKDTVLTTVMLECQEPDSNGFVDPRPTLLEAWLLAMIDLMKLEGQVGLDHQITTLLTDTCVAVISLLFYPTLTRPEDRTDDPGMSFDGPQSLALTSFFSHCFALPIGHAILEAACHSLSSRIPVDFGPHAQSASADARVASIAIVGAAFFRAVQGGLPPWAVESIPEVYSAFYKALGQDATVFGRVLYLSMEIRFPSNATTRVGGLQPGKLLSGRHFESLGQQNKEKLIQDAVSLANTNDTASWRRLKVLIKAACGGKKKDAGFQLKPSPTRWDFDRL
jgi:hypothetical protein